MMRQLRKRYGRAGKRLTRAALIDKLANELVRIEPRHYAGHLDDAKFRVSHTSPGGPDTLRDLALSAIIRGLITEDEYAAIAGASARLGFHDGRKWK